MIATLLFSLALAGASPDGNVARAAVMTGHFGAIDAASAPLDPVRGTSVALARLAAGLVPAGLDALEASLVRGSGSRLGRASALGAIATLGFGLGRAGLALVATSDDPMIQLLVHASAHDTLGVRRLLMRADAVRSLALRRNLPPPLLLAEAELAIGDSAAALARLESFERDWTTMDPDVEWGMIPNGWLLGRTWLLMGDVAQALGRTGVASRAYQRVVDQWNDGDIEVQGAVARARMALAARAAASRPTRAGYTLPSVTDRSDVRLDAAAWMNLPIAMLRDSSRAAVKLTLVTRQGTVDSVALDAPMLDALGDMGLALRRRAIAAARSMNDSTSSDLPGLTVASGLATLASRLSMPRGSIAVGESWRDTVAVGSGEDRVQVAFTCRLARVDSVAGVPVAVIELSGTGDNLALTGELSYRLDSGTLQHFGAAIRTTTRVPAGGMVPVRVMFTAVPLPTTFVGD